jgi:competence protein ComEC
MLQTAMFERLRACLAGLERFLEFERNQLPLWLPVALGIGIAAWFTLPTHEGWIATLLGGLAVLLAGAFFGTNRRIGACLLVGGFAVIAGCGLAWIKAEYMAQPVLGHSKIETFSGLITQVRHQAAQDRYRLIIATDPQLGMPAQVRITVPDDQWSDAVVPGQHVRLRARLMPPAPPAVPAGYDFARTAWFQQLGATGKLAGKIEILDTNEAKGGGLRDRISSHITKQLSGSEGGIAVALAMGDQGGISDVDQDAMRASGLAHLLSVSGLHITAVVGAVMFVALRLMSLSPFLALRWPLVILSALAGAGAGIGYTLITGAEVPTIRSCVAALLILAGLAMGREAMTLRLVATGALVVLLLWPEALMGPSFQLSFAAIASLVALHELPIMQRLTLRREEGWSYRWLRAGASLLLTGIVVELALVPIALFHFHKSGVYGALANMIAIPLTTFVIMPLEALALLFDMIGLGAPLWWLTAHALSFLLYLARTVAAVPGAVAMLPSVPIPAFAAMVGGGLWILLWRSHVRSWGAVPLAIGMLWAAFLPPPDVLITGDGRHLAVRGDDGQVAILRPRAGDYVRDMLAERSAYDGVLDDLDALRGAQCSKDMCTVSITRGGRTWRLGATRSQNLMPWAAFTQSCRSVDIMVSERRLPAACQPRWMKIDRSFLERSGGVAITLQNQRVETVNPVRDDHPWMVAAQRAQSEQSQYRRNRPASVP